MTRQREWRRRPVRRDEPVRLSDTLAAVGAELGIPAGNVHGRLDEHWVDVVGADVAAHARLVSVRDGVLTVSVDDPIWATQLRYLETTVIERDRPRGPRRGHLGAGPRGLIARLRKAHEIGRKATGSGGPSGTLGSSAFRALTCGFTDFRTR